MPRSRTLVTLTAWTTLFFVTAPAANAALIATYDLVPLSSTTIAPGQTVTVQVNLTTQDDSVGAGFYLSELTAAGFAITGLTRTATPFTDFTSTAGEITNPNAPSAGNNLLNPRNDRDLGGLEESLLPVAAGVYNLGTFTLNSTGVTPGTYGIGFGSPLEVLQPDTFENFTTINSNGLSITVQAIPEPGSLALCGIAAAGAEWIRRRKKNGATLEISPIHAARSASLVTNRHRE